MGVRGLTTFIATNQKKFLKDYKLHDCYLLIDGNSLAYHIYFKFCSRARCAFGGDYDRFAEDVRNFFSLLQKCNVKPILVFDGGHETRKVGTVIKRMTDRIHAMKHINPGSNTSAAIFPLLMKNVVMEVLDALKVPYVQCDFEADQEIASLARKYNCPVLSNDSDFYIFGVDYIPIMTIENEAVPLNFVIGETCVVQCVRCKIYKVEYFFQSFGGLDKSMLPLLASLLGNDYVNMRVFKKFYSQFKITKKKGNHLQKKIARIIEWLRNETFHSAVDRILGRMKLAQRKHVMESITKAVDAYTDVTATIEQYLPTEFTSRPVLNATSTIDSDHEMIGSGCEKHAEEMDVDNEDKRDDNEDGNKQDDDDGSLSDDDKDDDCCTPADIEMSDHVAVKIPDWFQDSFRKGNIDACLYDILKLRCYFPVPQAEDNFCKSSHASSIALLKLFTKLVVGNCFQDISIWMKNSKGTMQRFLLHLNNTPIVMNLADVPTLSVDDKKKMLIECLKLPVGFNFEGFPSGWQLYVCAIVYWINNTTEPQIAEGHVMALLMCMVSLSVVNAHVGSFRKKADFLKKYNRLQKKLQRKTTNEVVNVEEGEEDLDDDCDVVISEISTKEANEMTIQQIVSHIKKSDCVATFDSFYYFHLLDEKLQKNKKLFSKKTIHSFAQFQSCLYHVMIINSLLDYPLERPCISQLFSGTFVYNMCLELSKAKDVHAYLRALLQYSPNIFKLIESAFKTITSVAKVAVVQPSSKRNRCRKVKPTFNANADLDKSNEIETLDIDDDGNDENHEVYNDENNAFMLLSV